jgi:hypothetical protein
MSKEKLTIKMPEEVISPLIKDRSVIPGAKEAL